MVKKLGIKVAPTQEAEQIPTLKCSEYAVYARIVKLDRARRATRRAHRHRDPL
jgi:hypothetical protein